MFKVKSKYSPAGDQPQAIESLVKGVNAGMPNQVLLGATGTGKTYTIANVIEQTQKTTLVLSHNKTLAAQLYSELKALFPDSRVEYFVSYFDYYRPEAYLPRTDTYIDKTSKGNWDLEAMRMSALNALSTRKDTIVVASVASIYGSLSAEKYRETFFPIEVGMNIDRDQFIHGLVAINYSRNNVDQAPGSFRVRGDVIDISPGWTRDFYIRVEFFGDEIEGIKKVDYETGEIVGKFKDQTIFPADAYTTNRETIVKAIDTISKELKERLAYFEKEGKLLEKQRLEQRVKSDLESLDEFGICSGIENYSMHLDERVPGERPYTILDYMPEDSLMIVDESHMMIPQLHAMYNADRSRKENLVNYGFRLPSALENRPLKFEEWENEFPHQKIFVSATPADYELDLTHGEVVAQIVRPTGLLDPEIYVQPTTNQVEDIFDRIQDQKKRNERTFILTVTKRAAEELTRYLQERGEKVAYVHSEHKTFERTEILRKLRLGVYDTLIGINLLREGIDVPEVSLVLMLDADQESFFRSTRAMIQIVGRAARNSNGRVIMYGDRMTKSMKETIDETAKRREIQKAYNEKHGIIPKTIIKDIPDPIHGQSIDEAIAEFSGKDKNNKKAKKQFIASLRGQMLKAAKDMDFERAAQLRDLIIELQASE